MFAGGFAVASVAAFAQAAAVCRRRAVFTVAASGTTTPFALTTTFPTMPGWSVQSSLYAPTFANVIVALTGLLFGPGESTPVDTSPLPGIAVPPTGPNAAPL